MTGKAVAECMTQVLQAEEEIANIVDIPLMNQVEEQLQQEATKQWNAHQEIVVRLIEEAHLAREATMEVAVVLLALVEDTVVVETAEDRD